jgi:hypothetical protein
MPSTTRTKSATIQFFAWPKPEKRLCTITNSPPLQAVEIVLLSRHHPLLIADFSLREGVERFLRDSARLVSYYFALCPGDLRKA